MILGGESMKAAAFAVCVMVGLGAFAYSQVGNEAATESLIGTIVRGLEWRQQVLHCVSGLATFEYTFSPRRNAQDQQAAEQNARAIGYKGDIAPLDRTHSSLLNFAIDLEGGRWRCEVVDGTNSGHHLWASTRYPEVNRHIPPEYFYRASFSDGEKVYEYDRSTRSGRIRWYRPELCWVPQPLQWIRQYLIVGVHSETLAKLRSGEYSAVFVGRERRAGHSCLKIVVHGIRKDIHARMIGRMWIAPDLGFYAIRNEEVFLNQVAPGEHETLRTAVVVEGKEFTEVAEEVYCPRTVTFHRFDYTQGTQREAWDTTVVIRCRAFRAESSVSGIVTPYPFPFDTYVHDECANASNLPPRPSRGVVEANPDSWALGLTAQSVRGMLSEGRDSASQ